MAIVSHIHPFVVAVDTHARTHTLAIVVATTGDMDALWVIEGSGSCGAGIARAAAAHGSTVVEAPRMDARARRGTGKSDPINARAIAAAVLPVDEQQLRRQRRDDGTRAAFRVLVTARELMTDERTANVNALTGLVRAVDLGIDARNALTSHQIIEISRWRSRDESLADATARAEAVRLARRVIELSDIRDPFRDGTGLCREV